MARIDCFVDGEEKPGLIAYGLAGPGAWRDVVFPADAWFAQSEPEVFDLYGESWRVHVWEVPLATWPTGIGFQGAVSRTLDALIRCGSAVAWIGAEGIPFCDPPGAL